MNEPTFNPILMPVSTTRTLSPYYDEEISLIHRSFKQKEIEWNKIKIKMEQKIEFMEIQLKEINDRETNLKNLNNSIMTAFNDISKDPPTTKIPKEIEILNDQHSREMFEIKRKYEKNIKELEQEREDYKKKEFSILEDKTRLEKELKHFAEKNFEYEQRFMKWDESIFLREKHLKECLDTENGLKLRELRNEMIKLKELHNKEKESIDLISQKTLESLKSSFEQERKLLLGKMDAMKEEIGILNRNNSKNNSIYEELKGKMNEEVLGIKQNKEDLILKLENSMNTIQNLRFQIKENEQCYENRVKNYKEEKVLLQEEVKRLKQLIVENQNKIKKIEHSEKTLRTLLNEKESYVDEEKSDLKKKVFNEKKKNEQMLEFVNKFKEDYNKKHAIIVQEILNKEEEIKKLKQTISKMTNSARRQDKSQEKSPFRTSCYHQQCTAKGNNTSDNFYENTNYTKPVEENKHFCTCNDQSRIEHNNVQNNLMKSLYNVKDLPNKSSQEFKDNTDKSIIITEKNYDITLLNKSAKITEKNYDLPLKRENLEIPLKRDYKEISLKKESLEIPLKRESLEIPGNFQNKNNNSNDINRTIQKSHTLKPKPCQKDYSKKLTCLRNKENEIQKHQQLPTRQKNLTILDPNRSMFLEPNHDYTTIKSKEISTTKSKLSSKSPKIIKKPEFLKRNRSISKQDKTNTTSNNFIKNLGLEAQETIKNLSPTNNHLTINNMIGVLNLPTSIECTICKKIINVTDFMDHLSHCSTHLVENPSDSNHQTIFSDISNIQNNLSFNTSTENQELVEKRQRHIGTIHESIPNDRVLNRKTDENFFSLAPGFNLESDIGGNFIKNESNRYGDSPSNVNMTNEFSTSHRKGLIQDNLINSSFVIKSMNEIKRNSKK